MPSPNQPPDTLLEVLAACIEAMEHQDTKALEAALAAHPQHAPAVRARLDFLARAGMIAEQPPAADTLEPFGAFTIGAQLGAGGMGSVWAAEQTHPVRRPVALKVIKPGMDSAEILRRFTVERQTLASMNHPNIAQLFDAGVTPSGRPYFAMELVDGEPITTYADRHQLTTSERLRLIIPVLEAVQHAHQKGVIHRDLKPGNLLVTERDGSPVVKVIDFGVAKAMQSDATEGPAGFTESGRIIGTPEYMSPEQAGESGYDNLDTRSDIYAIGVVLYELLTSALPLDSQQLRSAGWGEMMRVIQEEDPPPPSARVTTLDATSATRIADARRTTVATLRRQLRGELDWITTRALEKDRDERYASAKDFADDLRRYSRGQPVAAGPRRIGYRIKKWMRRHAVGTAAATVAAGGLVAGLVVSVRSNSVAQAALKVAASNFANARAAVDEMLTKIGSESLEHVPRMEGVRREVLTRAVEFYEGFVNQLAANPAAAHDVHLELAQARLRLAQIQRQLGDHPQAAQQCRLVIGQITALASSTTLPIEFLAVLGTAHANLGRAQRQLGQSQAAHASVELAIELLRRATRSRPGFDRGQGALAGSLLVLGQLKQEFDTAADRGQVELREALAIYRQARAVELHNRTIPRQIVNTTRSLARDLRRNSEHDQGIPQLEACQQMLETLLAERDDPGLRTSLANIRGDLAVFRAELGQAQDATAAFQSQIEVWQQLVRDYPTILSYQTSHATSIANLGTYLSKHRQLTAAEASFARAVAIRERVHKRYPDRPQAQSTLASDLGHLLNTRIAVRGNADTADLHVDAARCVQLTTDLHTRFPNNARYAQQTGDAYARAAHLHTKRANHERARQAYARGHAALRQAVEQDPDNDFFRDRFGIISLGLAAATLMRGDEPGALAVFAQWEDQSEAALKAEPPSSLLLGRRTFNRVTWARILVATRRFDRAHVVLSDIKALAAARSPGQLVAAAELLTAIAQADSDHRSRAVGEAIEALEHALELGLRSLTGIKKRAKLAYLIRRPEFQSFAAKHSAREPR